MELQSALKKHFGYSAFRPLQEEIVRDALAGRDVFALMPTGGGKSLCFQLPALLRDGLTIVVSPLISLMKDQVDALQASGVAATFSEFLARWDGSARSRLRGLYNGEFRLLYVAPERLMLESFLEKVQGWNIAQIAIDEAHCISEWGHDFRPEYRELDKLRAHLPDVPIDGPDRHRDRAGARGYSEATQAARAALLRRQLSIGRTSPIASSRNRRPTINCSTFLAEPAERQRHRLLRQPQERRTRSRRS